VALRSPTHALAPSTRTRTGTRTVVIKVKIGQAYDPRKRPRLDEDSERIQRALLPSPMKPPGFTLDALIVAVSAVGFVMLMHGLITGWL